MELNREHFRAIIYYNFQRQLSQQECLAELLSVFGNEEPHQSTISRWYGEFKRGPRENVDAVRKLIIEDRHVTYREIEASLKISKTAIQKIFHAELGVRKLVSRWIPPPWGHIATIPLDEQRTVTVYTTISSKNQPPRRIILHQVNASSHTAQKIRQYLTEENVGLLDHSPYSPNDFFTFPKIKNRLRGQRFQSPEEAWNKCFENWFERMLIRRTVQRILKAHSFPPYKIHLVQELNEDDFNRRLQFCEDMINRHKCRYWSDSNPRIYHEVHTQQPQKLNVWADAIDPALTAIIESQSQDGAPPHYALCVRQYLDQTFPDRWTVSGYSFVYGFVNGNAAEAAREYARRFPNRRHPTRSVFVRGHRQIIENGFGNLQRDQNINVRQRRFTRMILREFDRDPTTSVRRVSGALGISASHVHRLQPGDGERRITFCQWILDRTDNNRELLSNVLWTDESCFTRRGVVNFHNQHIWSHENPHAVRERNFQHEFSVNVWIGIYRNRLFGPYLLPARLNAATFLEFLKAEDANILDDVMLDLRRLAWFQLDGCPAHYSRTVRNWLDEHYPERWIGRGGPVAWPPRSPGVNRLDFFVWGVLKEKVYQTPVTTRDMLIDRIRNACVEIRPYLNNAIPRSIIRRCELCIEQLGLYFEQLL
ncbi:unnamed protein product [Acanthoscelides obtectus]|uniref:Transposase n=1 Tax=Acanthoscelides obtectus TaxID=200917 RepID=A0A9P0MGM1_ACAOB|nr:unnamed protein product [Acanthoscelides obtectus]CAK1688248.1 hypothetical protein AOBTE_LOCUS36643 [Acanthoscelides obtectus]